MSIYKRLKDLWDVELKSNDDLLCPVFPRLPSANVARRPKLLIVGMNPSFGKKSWLRREDVQRRIHGKADTFFAWKNVRADGVRNQAVVEHDQHARQNHPYFINIRSFANELGCEALHLDLFAFRADNYSELFSKLNGNCVGKFTRVEDLGKFAIGQLNVFQEIVECCSVEAIVIANATASKIVEEMNWGLQYNGDAGYHSWKMSARTHKVFFSGPLNGVGTMDRGSRQRLQWHIRSTLRSNA